MPIRIRYCFRARKQHWYIITCIYIINSKHLKYVDEIPENEKEPFIVPKEFKLSKKKNSKAINKTQSWLPFTNEEVTSLYESALEKNDWTLGQLILLDAYTGARIEELCSLKKEQVNVEKVKA